MLLDGNILLTAKLLSGLRSVSGKTSGVRDSKAGAFDRCCSGSAADDRRTANAVPRQGGLKLLRTWDRRESVQPTSLTEGCHRVRTSQAHLHRLSSTSWYSVCGYEPRARQALPGDRASSCPTMDCGLGKVAKFDFCSLSYLSLTLCCVAPCSGWRGGHATLHRAMESRTWDANSCRDRLGPLTARRKRSSSPSISPGLAALKGAKSVSAGRDGVIPAPLTCSQSGFGLYFHSPAPWQSRGPQGQMD